MAEPILDRLMRYVRIHTTSDSHSSSVPSTARQLDLLRMLRDELSALGASEVTLDEFGYVMATIPATVAHDVPVIAFLAHVDTAPDFSGENVRPIVHRNYDGGKIVLPDDPRQVLDPAADEWLARAVGKDIVTASGTTLLAPTTNPASPSAWRWPSIC